MEVDVEKKQRPVKKRLARRERPSSFGDKQVFEMFPNGDVLSDKNVDEAILIARRKSICSTARYIGNGRN